MNERTALRCASAQNRPVGVKKNVRVAFDCPGAYSLIATTEGAGIGGAEVRALTFARQMTCQPETDVELIVSSELPRQAMILGKLRVTFEPRRQQPRGFVWKNLPQRGWHTVRRFSARWSSSLSQRVAGLPARRPFVESIRADVLCCFGVTNRTASVVRTARRCGIATIVFLTSDRTLEDIQRIGRRDRGVFGELGELCRYALRHADSVVVQKCSQQRRLREQIGIDSHLIRNPIDLTPVGDHQLPEAAVLPNEPFVLWVGRGETFSKRADLALAIARKCPRVPFVLIMNRHDSHAYEALLESKPNNVVVIERVDFAHIELVYKQATLLLNTSAAEGFPNSLLQAGKYGVPTVSLQVDPDQILETKQLGLVAHGDISVAAAAIQRWIRRPDEYVEASRRVRAYVQANHALSDRGQELWRCICSTLERRHRPRVRVDLGKEPYR